MAKKNPCFDVTLTDDARAQLADDLCTEVEQAFSARTSMIGAGGIIDLCDWFYEQGRTDPRDLPFLGAADLTSYLVTQDVDGLKARLLKGIFGVTPFCYAEAHGPDEARAGYVESFMDWQVRKSTLKVDLAKTILGALLEDAYILEVSEKIETRKLTETIDVAIETDETGAALFTDGKVILKRDPETGEPLLAKEGEQAATVERTYTKTKRLGPQFDPISMKDFVFLPGHAKSSKRVWGYAYRFTARLPELQERVEDEIYDADAVKAMGEQPDQQDGTPSAEVAPQQGPSTEKELFQLALKRDLDGDGREEWYIATISLPQRVLLRLKLDKFVMKVGRPRCVPFVLFPRRDSVYGYSFAGNKILTLAEEHTALRNMKADRSALATNAPIKRRKGALWDPDTQPFGVGRVIDVNELAELEQMQIADVPTSIVEQEHAIWNANERVSGLSDTAVVGTMARQSNTLGQDQMISRASAVRVDEVFGYLHLAISDVMALAHAIWVETLEADPKGMEAPTGVVAALGQRDLNLPDGRFTAAQIKGDFHFQPYGSDETSDPERRISKFNNKFLSLANLGKVFPPVQAVFMSPDATKAIIEEWGREYGVKDIKPYLQALQMAMPPAPPGSGPGMAPPPGEPMGGGLEDMLAAMGTGGAPSGY